MISTAVIPVPAGTDLAPPPLSLAIREDEFQAWLDNAKPGSRVEYHRGRLVIDREPGLSPFGEKQRRELNAVADRALALANEGRLLLVQRRHGRGDYSYFAIKPKRPQALRKRGGR